MRADGMSEPTTDDPIVISGLAVEAPGGVDTPEALWSALAGARELLGPFPRDRGWPVDDILSDARTADGWRRVSDAGGFLDGAAAFDPTFFGLTHHEAMVMHPHQRVAMRVAWKAVENAGINPATLDGSEGGCFVGMSMSEYGMRTTTADDYTGFRTVGMGQLGGAGRISHCLGLVGPSISIDSACASSLTAVQLAANAIALDECDWAIAGAVSVLGEPGGFYEFSRLNAISADGHCKAYSDDATGTVWGEGAGMVVVERESRARQLGHRIHGRIMAIRTNHNGKGKPILVPRTRAQAQLVTKTVDAAGCEAQLGSIKSNVGHAQAASGMLGLTKLLLAGQHGHIPPTLFSDNPTKTVDWDSTGLRLATKLHPWEPKNGVRYGAVSSFGAGGANAHAIIAMAASSGE
jgi:mycobactin polyketide synthetase MbtC